MRRNEWEKDGGRRLEEVGEGERRWAYVEMGSSSSSKLRVVAASAVSFARAALTAIGEVIFSADGRPCTSISV